MLKESMYHENFRFEIVVGNVKKLGALQTVGIASRKYSALTVYVNTVS